MKFVMLTLLPCIRTLILDTGILQDLAKVMIRDCRYDVSNMLLYM